jgi:hypothetical protein
MNGEDRLDAVLAGDMAAFTASPEVQSMVAIGDEVGGALAAWTLDPESRARIYASAVALAGAAGLGDRLRALGLDRRVQAIAGGAVVTLAATALSVAIARGRRHPSPNPATLGA